MESIDNWEFESEKKQLINFGNKFWGAGNWNYAVTSQNIDNSEFENGLHAIGVVTTLKLILKDGSYREDIGYATAKDSEKGFAIFQARKRSVINALKEVISGYSTETTIHSLSPVLRPNLKTIASSSNVIKPPEVETRKSISKSISEPSNDVTNSSTSRSIKILKTDHSSDITNANDLNRAFALNNKNNKTNLEAAQSSVYSANFQNNKANLDGQTSLLAPKLPTRTDNNVEKENKVFTATVTTSFSSNSAEKNQNEDICKAERLRRQKQKQEEYRRMIQNQGKQTSI